MRDKIVESLNEIIQLNSVDINIYWEYYLNKAADKNVKPISYNTFETKFLTVFNFLKFNAIKDFNINKLLDNKGDLIKYY